MLLNNSGSRVDEGFAFTRVLVECGLDLCFRFSCVLIARHEALLAGVANAGQWIAHSQETKSAVYHDPLRVCKKGAGCRRATSGNRSIQRQGEGAAQRASNTTPDNRCLTVR